MKVVFFSLCFILCFAISSRGQELITGTYNFQTDPAKKYAVYVPSGYDANVSSKVILGLHPWNVSKWDAESWAEELSEVAEANNCLVICPDGGADGQIDDQIDTAFTSFLLDEMILQYNIDEAQIFVAGFSWGGKTTYTYGLNHVDRFAGFMPIGAAVTSSEVSDFAALAEDKAFYIIHGSQDSPNNRFYPLVDLMEDAGACVETNLLSGIGHTVEFPNQFNILNDGLQYLINSTCGIINGINDPDTKSTMRINLKSNLLYQGQTLQILSADNVDWKIYDMNGRLLKSGREVEVDISLNSGLYLIEINHQIPIRFVVR